jgi:hypothetical protein
MLLGSLETPISMPERIRCRRTIGLADLANSLSPLRSSILGVLTLHQNVLPTIRTIIGRVERGFADFAKIPYHDAYKRQELSRLLEKSVSDCRTE